METNKQVDVLFGNFDPDKVKSYFESNSSNMFKKVSSVIESHKHLLIYQSQADPYTVFLKIINAEGFNIDDIILLVSMVIVFGRSLKSLNKQREGEAGKAFISTCTKYRIMYSYNKKKMEGDARRYTIKCEHIFAAFPYIAQSCQIVLVESGLITLTTPFTSKGLDFQSSTALSLWKDPQSFGELIFLHELKNQLYIQKRTGGVDYQAMSRRVTYKPTGEEMTQAQARERQAIDSRQYTVLGMCSPDLIVKLLWAVDVNCPPFKSKPAYMFIDAAGQSAAKAIGSVVQPISQEIFSSSKARCAALSSQSGITNQFQTLLRESGIRAQEFHSIGHRTDVLSMKIFLFLRISSSLGIDSDKVQRAMEMIGFPDLSAPDLPFKTPQDDDKFIGNSACYDALISHLREL